MEPDAATAGSGVFFLFVLLLVGFGFYFLPSIVGQLRGAKAKNQVWVVNF